MSRATRDALIVVVATIVAYIIAFYADLYEKLHVFLVLHEHWEADEILVTVILLGVASCGYALLRLRDLREEVSFRAAAEARAEHVAFHDLITGLPNRNFVQTQLERVVADNGAFTTVALIDINNFKRINDLVGNHGGDVFLATFARQLGAAAPGAFLARMGGDEFLVIATPPEAEAEALAQLLAATCCQPQMIDGYLIQTNTAIGFVTLRSAGTLAKALHQAELAMQEAKREARRTGLFAPRGYEPRLEEELARRLLIETELREAIADDRLVPYFQPLVRLGDGTTHGFEALARWPRPDGSFVPPDIFIGIAENAGLVTKLSDNLLRSACRVARAWPANLILYFNISPRQLTDRLLVSRILRILEEVDFPPNRLSVEITESAIIDDIAGALRILDQLRAADVRVALDDFGTGYSSFAQLARFPFNTIKIDRHFTASILENEKQTKIVRSLLRLSSALEVSMLAEGIETVEQCARLRAMGCYLGQGYLLGRPMPAEAVPGFLEQASARWRQLFHAD
ncbi:putative bifunctional diguanylate cyclase/phosphodiesterase [Ancylobacter pratisalsi]|uniref:Bifunctional diguanylate cyclase/phosphodiesterase n=1 Tax=Ancylobacter pratisalsi TaxID=1745854 RepID=A0A6P1YJ74_9HYPH|nr:bifunctional diguanylate cyclase/phosphodiesterase [Ancylobacter pratisalsi]QIB33185.1 bifunctional diguanylate cyclase/phosphodiesterase [Ancylobacter pratisalsi]